MDEANQTPKSKAVAMLKNARVVVFFCWQLALCVECPDFVININDMVTHLKGGCSGLFEPI